MEQLSIVRVKNKELLYKVFKGSNYKNSTPFEFVFSWGKVYCTLDSKGGSRSTVIAYNM